MKFTFNIFDKVLLISVFLCFSFLIIIQFLNYNNEGIINTSWFAHDYAMSLNDKERLDKGIIILKNLNPSYENIKILVNGEEVADFAEKDEVEVNVYNNDIVEIDGTMYNDKVNVKVVGISKNIERPFLDEIVTTFQSIEILCKVQLK